MVTQIVLLWINCLTSAACFTLRERPELVHVPIYFDRFNDQVTLAYAEGWTHISCIPRMECCDKYRKIELADADDNNAVAIASEDCEKDKPVPVEFKFRNTEIPFKKMVCRQGKVKSEDTYAVLYRLCSDTSEVCKTEKSCERNKFCVETGQKETEVTSCGNIPLELCDQTYSRHGRGDAMICPSTEPTQCRSFSLNYSGAWSLTAPNSLCGIGALPMKYVEPTTPKLAINGIIYSLNQPILITKQSEATISVTKTHNVFGGRFSCTFKKTDSTFILLPEQAAIAEEINTEPWTMTLKFKDYPLFDKLQLVKMACDMPNRHGINKPAKYFLYYILVVADPPDPKIRMTIIESPSKEPPFYRLTCSIPAADFEINYVWMNEKGEEISKNQTVEMDATGAVSITCKVIATYKTCSPHFSTTVHRTTIFNLPTTHVGAGAKATENDNEGHAFIPSLNVMSFGLFLIVAMQQQGMDGLLMP